MPVPTKISDLSATIASNSPSGSDVIAGTLDDYIRAEAGILRQDSLQKPWTCPGETATYATATTFTLVGDKTATYYSNRPIKIINNSGTEYVGLIVSSAFSVTTTVTFAIDGGTDPGSISLVYLGGDPSGAEACRLNLLMNWNFRFWQRNTTFTTTTQANTADGWGVVAGTGGSPSVTCSRQAFTIGQTDVPWEPQYFLRFDQTAAATSTAPFLRQHVENVRTMAGQRICISFWAKCAASTVSITPRVTQYFGTGGSPSSNVVTENATVVATTTWKRLYTTILVPSISGKTIGSNETSSTLPLIDSSLRIDLHFFPLNSTFTVDIANVIVEPGSTPSNYFQRPYDEALAQCQRRVFKTFAPDVTPSQNSGETAYVARYGAYRAGIANSIVTVPTPVAMRSGFSGAATFYSPSAAASTWYNVTTAAVSGASALVNARNMYGISISNAQAAGDNAGDIITVHFLYDVEWPASV